MTYPLKTQVNYHWSLGIFLFFLLTGVSYADGAPLIILGGLIWSAIFLAVIAGFYRLVSRRFAEYYKHCADCHERDIGSHVHPEAHFGLEGTAMSPFGETLSESEIRLLVDYLKSVRASNPD